MYRQKGILIGGVWEGIMTIHEVEETSLNSGRLPGRSGR